MIFKVIGMLFTLYVIVGFGCMLYVYCFSTKDGEVDKDLKLYLDNPTGDRNSLEENIIYIIVTHTIAIGFCIHFLKKIIKK